MAKGYVPIFFDWLDTTQDLTAEEKGNLIDAVVLYACGKEYEHLLIGACRIAFRFMQGQVDRNAKISKLRQEARLGKKQSDNQEQNATNINTFEQNATKNNENDQSETNLLNNNNNNNKNKNKDVSLKRFTPPTLDEVKAYCKERNNNVDPERWYDFYESKGWMVGSNHMKDWKAAIRTWERGDSKPIPIRPTKTVIAQQYEQRDYSAEQESLEDMVARLEGRSG